MQWQKSSFSDGEDAPNCVEVAAWQKSSYSGPEDAPNCVEVAARQGTRVLLLRESDEPDAVITATGAGLAALIRHLRP
ncbi:DUF397 domain-containing protein [Streptomyces phaeochromogenes]|uniref:DUF397 domain-containing protein n=1 Tax=Streptomyces phaeochromogenes TaxID=1923 RepID=UPI0033C2F5C4